MFIKLIIYFNLPLSSQAIKSPNGCLSCQHRPVYDFKVVYYRDTNYVHLDFERNSTTFMLRLKLKIIYDLLAQILERDKFVTISIFVGISTRHHHTPPKFKVLSNRAKVSASPVVKLIVIADHFGLKPEQ